MWAAFWTVILSVAYATALLCAAVVFVGGRLAGAIRALLISGGLLALAGLIGPVTGDMQLRNIGILFKRTTPSEDSVGH